ncbi:MAG TPA: oligosaccharide flippase family protein [Bryobacteraceae bacterium]|jgi:PST family polysaccharide transporter
MTPEKIDERRDLDKKFAGGLAWTAGAKWATQVLTWASVFAVARLLSQSDVGIGDIAGMFTGLTNVLAEFGIATAVLHMPELDRKTLGQLHVFSLLLCTGLFGLSVLAAPGIALFFHSDHVMLFVANNIGFLITGMQAVPFGLLQRDMDYRRIALLEAMAGIVTAIVTIVTAWYGWGYWALFAGANSGKFCGMVGLCYLKRVPFAWPRWSAIRKPVEMGRHVAIGRLAAAAYTFSDGIVIGRTMGEATLGTYRMAMNLASAPAEKISSLIMRTATPLFANVMNDPALTRRYYLIIVELLSLSVAPLMLGLVTVAPQAVSLVLSPKWIAATRPLQWLGLFMIFRVLGVVAEQVLVAQRLERFTMRMSVLSFVVMPVAFIFAARWNGPNGVAAAWITLSPVTIAPLLIILQNKISLTLREYAAALVPALLGSAVMCLGVFAIGRRLPSTWRLEFQLAVEVVAGGAVYAGFLLAFFRGRLQRYATFLAGLRKGKTNPGPVLA